MLLPAGVPDAGGPSCGWPAMRMFKCKSLALSSSQKSMCPHMVALASVGGAPVSPPAVLCTPYTAYLFNTREWLSYHTGSASATSNPCYADHMVVLSRQYQTNLSATNPLHGIPIVFIVDVRRPATVRDNTASDWQITTKHTDADSACRFPCRWYHPMLTLHYPKSGGKS